MTQTTPPPAEDAVRQAATTALPDDAIDPSLFVPASTRDNYLTIVRDQAKVRGVDPGTVRDELVEQFRDLHKRQPLDGYDHLAAVLAGADLTVGQGPTGMQVLLARTLESARRDPYQAVVGDQALVEQGVLAQQNADATVAAAAGAPSVDPASGLLPNPGPLPTPADVSTGDPAVREQQEAAAAQREPGEQQPTPTAPSGDATSTPSKSGGSGSGRHHGGSGSSNG